MKKKSIVLFSGGLDSSVNLYAARAESEILLAVTFDYGQRAFAKELLTTKRLCEKLKVPHKVINIPWLAEVTNTSLVSGNMEVPCGSDVQIDNHKQSLETAKAVWVPNRNGVFLNIGAAMAESLGGDQVIVGFNLEEAATFPDNSLGYMESLNHSFSYSTSNKVKVKSYTVDMNKTEIVKLGIELDVPFALLWPCYFSGDHICGKCESCQRFHRALKHAGVDIGI